MAFPPPVSPSVPTAGPRAGAEALQRLRRKERAENFPVALRVLPRRLRRDLQAVYDVVRVIDDLGDEAPGNRTVLLEDFARDLARVWDGAAPRSAVLRRLAPTVDECGLDREPFDRLIRANLQDQHVTGYATYHELLDYCALSAAPVGRIVLGVFGVASPARVALSDRICSALQLIEHWQDVAEDRRAGRVYLPREDLDGFGVRPTDLDVAEPSAAVRRLVVFETERAAALLDSGAPLVRLLRGWSRLGVAGYVAGGRAAVDVLRRSHGDVLAATPRPRRRDLLRHLAPQLTPRGLS